METETNTPRLIADDLFAGAGGWDVAADWLDVHARGVENMTEARATRDAAGLTTIHDDVWTFKPQYRGRTDAEVYAGVRAAGASHRVALIASGLIASPPCQTFSQAGKGSGRKALSDVLEVLPTVEHITLAELRKAGERFGDDRTALVLTPLWFALHHPYRWLAWEQVPTVLPVWEACAEVLRAHGWHVWTGKLNAEQYGVPQTRTRAFLLASRDHAVTPPTPTHSRYYSRTPSKLDAGVAKWVSMAEALGWPTGTRVVSNYGTGGDASKRGERTADQPAATVTSKVDRNTVRFPDRLHMNERPNGCRRPVTDPAPTMAFGHDSASCRWVYDPRETLPDGSPRWNDQSGTPVDQQWPDNRPATVVAGRDLVQNPGATANRYNGSTKSRNDGIRVTVAEAGVLQSFPADHPWQGGKSKQYLQAGNAVPPLLAMAALSAAMGEPFVPPTPVTVNTESAQPALAFN